VLRRAFCGAGQREANGRAHALTAFDPDVPAVSFYDVLTDKKPETRTGTLAGAIVCAISAFVTLKKQWDTLGRNALAVIGNRDLEKIAL
jgi:hypothetical protein